MTHLAVGALLVASVACSLQEPNARDLIERHDREKSAVWADGDRATFFYRGDPDQVTLLLGGEAKPLRRLEGSDVWTVSVERPELAKGVFSYAFSTGKKGDPPFTPGQPLKFEVWTGPEAPPAPAVAKELKGVEKMLDLESKILGETRKVKIYVPPGHDRSRSYPVIYAADGMTNADVLEPLIVAGKVRPLIVVGVLNGSYQGDRAKPYDIKQDLRAREYLPEVDADRFAKHEKFFSEEVRAWAETELGASRRREDRAVQGVSNGARFAVEMGIRHPELFGHVFGFSVASSSSSSDLVASARLPLEPDKLPRFHLAAGTWESGFHKLTSSLADNLKKLKVPVQFNSRVSGHDDAMWRQELVAGVLAAFGKKAPRDAG
jgi:enterochelin esterase-like enzyme